jgi:hypothetical protein
LFWLSHSHFLTDLNRGGLAVVAMLQLPRGSFFENARFLKMHGIKDIFRENEAFF